MRDILPSFIAALIMCVAVLAILLLKLQTIVTLILQVLVGVVVYVAISAIFRLQPYNMLMGMVKKKRKKQ